MARFIEKAALSEALTRHDWPAFARGYNGPAWRRNGYASKLARAYKRFGGGEASGEPARRKAGESDTGPTLLRRGDAGETVRDLQRALSALGYPLEPDGVFGRATQMAVRRFQTDHELTADGIAGPRTLAALHEALPASGNAATFWKRIAALLVRWLRGVL